MFRLSTSKARGDFAGVLKAVSEGAPVRLRRHSKPIAAIVPVEDLALLHAIEDRIDHKAAREAEADAEINGTIPREQVKAELRL